jgi:hypothetical protein
MARGFIEALWAYHISKHGATKVTPFELVYGQEAVLSVEVNLVLIGWPSKIISMPLFIII